MRISDWSSDVCSSDLDRDAFPGEHLPDRPTHLRLVAMPEHLCAAREDRHLGPEAGKHLAELKRDVAAADDEERSRQLLELLRLVVGEQVTRQVRHLTQPLDVREDWARDGGNQEALAGQLLATDIDRVRVEEGGRSEEHTTELQ